MTNISVPARRTERPHLYPVDSGAAGLSAVPAKPVSASPVPASAAHANTSRSNLSPARAAHANASQPNLSPLPTAHSTPARAKLAGQRRRYSDPTDVRRHLADSATIRRVIDDDEGAATAEYAIVIMAGVALAGVLVAIMKSGDVQSLLLDLVQRAFGAA